MKTQLDGALDEHEDEQAQNDASVLQSVEVQHHEDQGDVEMKEE